MAIVCVGSLAIWIRVASITIVLKIDETPSTNAVCIIHAFVIATFLIWGGVDPKLISRWHDLVHQRRLFIFTHKSVEIGTDDLVFALLILFLEILGAHRVKVLFIMMLSRSQLFRRRHKLRFRLNVRQQRLFTSFNFTFRLIFIYFSYWLS